MTSKFLLFLFVSFVLISIAALKFLITTSSTPPSQITPISKHTSNETIISISPQITSGSTSTTVSTSTSSSCTDDEHIRAFFGCQCGWDRLWSDPANAPCMFGDEQRNFNQTGDSFSCFDHRMRIVFYHPHQANRSFINLYATKLLLTRVKRLHRVCDADKAASRILPPTFWPLQVDHWISHSHIETTSLRPHILFLLVALPDDVTHLARRLEEFVIQATARKVLILVADRNLISKVDLVISENPQINQHLLAHSALTKIIVIDIFSPYKKTDDQVVVVDFFDTICNKCTKTPPPLPNFPPLPPIDNSSTAPLFQHEIYEPSKDYLAEVHPTTICPPGSTADCVWGLNDARFNSLNFYAPPKKKQIPGATAAPPFGKWVTSYDVKGKNNKSQRTAFLNLICREEDTTTSFVAGDGSSGCEFINKPQGWTPFAAPAAFQTDVAAAIYISARKKNDKQQQSVEEEEGLNFGAKKYPVFSGEASNVQTTTLSFCYDFQNPSRCLYGKTILFIGDSHILNIAQTICRMLLKKNKTEAAEVGQYKGICGPHDFRFQKSLSKVYLPDTNTTLAMFRVRYDVTKQMKRFYEDPWSAQLLKADFVVIHRGMWDIVFNDTEKRHLSIEYENALRFIAQTFRRARIIVKFLHYDHKKLKGCATDARIRDVRDATICAAHRAAVSFLDTKEQDNNSLEKIYSKFAFLDYFGMSRELPYTEEDDFMGHHYQGSIQESMVQMLFSIMCPSQRQNYKLIFEQRGQSAQENSCARLWDKNNRMTKHYVRPVCGCANDNIRPPHQYCLETSLKNPIPFILDM